MNPKTRQTCSYSYALSTPESRSGSGISGNSIVRESRRPADRSAYRAPDIIFPHRNDENPDAMIHLLDATGRRCTGAPVGLLALAAAATLFAGGCGYDYWYGNEPAA